MMHGMCGLYWWVLSQCHCHSGVQVGRCSLRANLVQLALAPSLGPKQRIILTQTSVGSSSTCGHERSAQQTPL